VSASSPFSEKRVLRSVLQKWRVALDGKKQHLFSGGYSKQCPKYDEQIVGSPAECS
jgi:hypothetical protein